MLRSTPLIERSNRKLHSGFVNLQFACMEPYDVTGELFDLRERQKVFALGVKGHVNRVLEAISQKTMPP